MIATVLSGGREARAKVLMIVAAMLVAGGSVLLVTTIGGSIPASAATGLTGTIKITPDTGLTNGSVVTITGTGFTKSSIGNVLECNDDATQPNVMVGGLVNSLHPRRLHRAVVVEARDDQRHGDDLHDLHRHPGNGRPSVRPVPRCGDVPSHRRRREQPDRGRRSLPVSADGRPAGQG